MSSLCSVNSCMSPDVTSSNVSSNKLNDSVIHDISSTRLRSIAPEITKDNKYWERRRRNNEAARRSREKRRMNDMNIDHRIMELSQRNKLLEQELFRIKMGNVSTNQTAHYQSQNKKTKLTPIIPSTESFKDKSNSPHINGIVCPIFTTIKPVSSSPNITEPSNFHGLSNPSNGSDISIKNDNSTFQTNLLTFSNIPILSSIIAAPNNHEDVITKPTLLLPPFQFPPKILDQTHTSDDFILIPANVNSITSPKSYTKEEAVVINNVKVDLSGILDLTMKQESGNHLVNFNGGLPSLIGPKTFSAQKLSLPRSRRKATMGQYFDFVSRVQVRKEISKIVRKESSKLHDAILCLNEEIKKLTSLLLPVVRSFAHVLPMTERSTCISQDPPVDP